MDTFDPDRACQVHDGLNDQLIEWRPQWAAAYREHAAKWDEGVVSWDGLLLDGWTPTMLEHPCGH
ncbi:hypothetical protein SAMN05216573_102199 [Bradyrhizobium sp. Rc3b]|uniref:hypothetical protein n=1 Tax=Bradyrhizobium sp. Rc3b TaxID=1855322 RepID=UPI0008EA804B|nr:hypothetical protein [Bradyrhizobium sp. Rc3b]SFM51096.1 hypothetical protein SAMN05216573_102199 [Bradyrhizobium sp. Rc3b]